MKIMTVVATYKTQQIAEKVIDNLTDNDHPRKDIGLAVNPDTGEALLAVTVTGNDLDSIMNQMKDQTPNLIEARERGWRQGNTFSELHPNAENFVAVDLKDER